MDFNVNSSIIYVIVGAIIALVLAAAVLGLIVPSLEYGGDYGILHDFLGVLRSGGESRTSARVSLQSHLMCFAAERSRKENAVIELDA